MGNHHGYAEELWGGQACTPVQRGTSNWLRILGAAELPHNDQGVRYQFHAKMSLLNVFKTKKQPLECIFPDKCPIDVSPQGMDGGVE